VPPIVLSSNRKACSSTGCSGGQAPLRTTPNPCLLEAVNVLHLQNRFCESRLPMVRGAVRAVHRSTDRPIILPNGSAAHRNGARPKQLCYLPETYTRYRRYSSSTLKNTVCHIVRYHSHIRLSRSGRLARDYVSSLGEAMGKSGLRANIAGRNNHWFHSSRVAINDRTFDRLRFTRLCPAE
jgi:hypothetical protein